MMKTLNALGAATVLAGLFLFSAPAMPQSQHDLEKLSTYMELMDTYLDIIEGSYDISADSEKAAILHMQKIQEVYEERGEKPLAADAFREILKSSRNQTIRNAAYIFLGENLKENGQTEEALEVFREGLAEALDAAK